MENEAARHLMCVARKIRMCSADIAKKYDLRGAEIPFFIRLSHEDGLTQAELTNMVGVDKALTTRVIRTMEQKGFIIRKQDENDKRQSRIYRTEKVEQVKAGFFNDMKAFYGAISGGIGDDDMEIFDRVLVAVDRNMAEYMKRENVSFSELHVRREPDGDFRDSDVRDGDSRNDEREEGDERK
ncbi:MAG: MarR family transcriptional regulator [Eubacteriales bacterium]|nr:MarR family transcriptional regulator [Eubacteriales bacterium]